MSYADIILLGEDKDPEHVMRWQHNGEVLPDAGDIVELAAPVPGEPGVSDSKHVLSVGVVHRLWRVDGSIALVCNRLYTIARASE